MHIQDASASRSACPNQDLTNHPYVAAGFSLRNAWGSTHPEGCGYKGIETDI